LSDRPREHGVHRRRALLVLPFAVVAEMTLAGRWLVFALILVAIPSRPTVAEDPPACSTATAQPAGPTPVAQGAMGDDGRTKDVGWERWNYWRSHCLTVHLGTRQMLDFTVFGQDATSVAQLGKIDPQFQWREAKFFINGNLLCFESPWAYAAELVRWASVKIGRQATPFSLEILTSGGNLQFMERALKTFDIGNQGGVTIAGTTDDERLTWTLGAFSNAVFGGSGVVVASRTTGLPVYEDGGSFLLHLELGARYVSPPGATQEFQGRPATNVGPYFVDTGAFVAPTTWEVDAALLLITGPVSVQAEILDAISLSSQVGDPNLWGWYVTASWLPTGETRPYNTSTAVPGYVVPRSKWGALELAARYFVIDLNGGALAGGVMRDVQVGASWFIGKLFSWSTDQMFRIDVNYGHVWLDRFGTVGNSDVIGFRLQASI
ncbi:MAG: porin, partial [Deltaproteobacteria bacterium]|nr:porin [Deltaproteobacteria bacterium]